MCSATTKDVSWQRCAWCTVNSRTTPATSRVSVTTYDYHSSVMLLWLSVCPAVSMPSQSQRMTITRLSCYFDSLSVFMPPTPLKNVAGGILYSDVSVREWVRKSVHPENLANTMSQKPMKGISQNFGSRCTWLHRCAD